MSISHLWNGTTLIITTSEGSTEINFANLQGETGPRGPQGPAGVVYDADGNLVLHGYATEDYVDNTVAGYATENYVSAEIAKAQLAGSDADIDVDALVTQDELDAALEDAGANINIDNKTIIRDASGNISTAIGGYRNAGGVDYKLNNIEYTPPGPWDWNIGAIGNIGTNWMADSVYSIKMTFKDGAIIVFDAAFEWKTLGSDTFLYMVSEYKTAFAEKVADRNIGSFSVGPNYGNTLAAGDFQYSLQDMPDNGVEDKFVLTNIEIYCPGWVPIDAEFIPIDGETIKIIDGKLVAMGGGASYPSSEEVEY